MKRIGDLVAKGLFGTFAALAIGFLLVPSLVSIVLSFDARDYLGAFPPPSYSLRWYAALLSNETYVEGLKVSLQIGAAATLVSVLAGGMAAIALDRYALPGRSLIEAALLSPKFVPTVVIGFSLLGLLSLLGIRDGWWRLFAGHVVITLPFTVRATLAALHAHRRPHQPGQAQDAGRPHPRGDGRYGAPRRRRRGPLARRRAGDRRPRLCVAGGSLRPGDKLKVRIDRADAFDLYATPTDLRLRAPMAPPRRMHRVISR